MAHSIVTRHRRAEIFKELVQWGFSYGFRLESDFSIGPDKPLPQFPLAVFSRKRFVNTDVAGPGTAQEPCICGTNQTKLVIAQKFYEHLGYSCLRHVDCQWWK